MTSPLLEARGVRVLRPGDNGPIAVLDGVNLTLARGEVLDISGQSGSGKTTLLRALSLMLPGVTGEIVLEGQSAESIVPRAWRTRVALLPQRAVVFCGTVRDNLLVPWTLKARHGNLRPDDEVLREALDSVGMDDVVLDRDAARLSVGQAARIALLRVVLTAPDVLLLDEPDASLDELSAAQVAAGTVRFAEGGGGVVRVRHHRPDAVQARRVCLACGRLEAVGDGS